MAGTTTTVVAPRQLENEVRLKSVPTGPSSGLGFGSSTSHDVVGSSQLPTEAPCRPAKEDVGWRRIVRNFTPSWFAVNMGTGIVSVLVHSLPYSAPWVEYIADIFFVLNIVLFTSFTVITVLRYTLYPEIWSVMVRHPAQSLFLGCFPMGFSTIISMITLTLDRWGSWTITLAWSFWWLDVALSIASLFLVFPIIRSHHLDLKNVTAALLFPFVPCVVASGSGGLLAGALQDPNHALVTLIVSYVLWGIGQAFSVVVLGMYFQRLCLHSLPPKEAIVSVFLPVGPLGQGGFAIQQLGRVALSNFPVTGAFGTATVQVDPARIGETFYAVGIFLAIVMWGAGFVWLTIALVTIATTKNFPFNMGWWGFTFPLGVFTTCTGLLAGELDSTFLKVLTMIFSLSVVALWLLVATRTLLQVITGEMFHAPCLKDLRPKESQHHSNR
ncbi:hypothetical protein GQ53DRAFT_644050 [Thozetella sp. PMI_491]|nr:hypothetical protein GQ53DRAFT_644050 [Thozetella sp. PMI_491]